ncbi:hypothetical protein LIER_24078 [Lithospermum erythrorhizon]|uniref:Uncharacterized protein n=1 Tax=Lithospermum erythrorhizon TaxID=34254 RepID=A0AAV3R3I3_LITER
MMLLEHLGLLTFLGTHLHLDTHDSAPLKQVKDALHLLPAAFLPSIARRGMCSLSFKLNNPYLRNSPEELVKLASTAASHGNQ